MTLEPPFYDFEAQSKSKTARQKHPKQLGNFAKNVRKAHKQFVEDISDRPQSQVSELKRNYH